jgi:lipoyl(octanoyl) transferase
MTATRDARRETRGGPTELSSAQRVPSLVSPLTSLVVKRLGFVDYVPTWHAMQAFTAGRDDGTPDELWVVEHPPVYTLGIAAKAEHLPRADNSIRVIRTDRGGQITYHGPGQVVIYLLLDLRRRQLGVRQVVGIMEQAVIELLGQYGIEARERAGAPGVYVGASKIAALGLRIRNGCCYHGLALNVAMDLTPYQVINPCGYPGLEVTQAGDLGITDSLDVLGDRLVQCLLNRLNESAAKQRMVEP